MLLNVITSLLNLKGYINIAKFWTLKQMGGNGLEVEKMGSEWVGGRHQFFSEKHFYFCFLQPYFQRQNTSMSTHLHCLPTSSSIFLYICFLSLYTVESSLLCQRTLRWSLSSLVSVSSPWSGVRRFFRWLLGFFYGNPYL